MKLVEINWHPNRSQLRQFGLVALGALPLAGWIWGAGPATMAGLTAAGALLALVGLAWPPALKPVFVGLSVAAIPIGLVVGEIALAAVYYVVLTPLGLARRTLGRGGLELDFDRQAGSYWQAKRPPRNAESYLRLW